MTKVTEQTRLRPELRKLLDILRRHPGRAKAIRMIDLYEEWSGREVERNDEGRPIEDVATLSRHMRSLIDELREVHQIPVMSGSAYGYWIVTDQRELDDVHHEFTSRGLKSLQTAARLRRISLVDAVQQLALELQDDDSAIRRKVVDVQAPPEERPLGDLVLSPEAKMAVITKHLQEMIQSPDEYAEQIRALQRQFGPKLLPHAVAEEVRRQTSRVRDLAQEAITAANKLQTMIERS